MTGLRVGIDARIIPGTFGGVEQFTLGLTRALTHLGDGNEEYVFLVNPGQHEWLEPFVGTRGRLLEATVGIGGNLPTHAPLLRRIRSSASTRLPAVRDFWRRVRGIVTHGETVPLPRSGEEFERAGVKVVHFPMQSAFLTSIPSIYQPWDLQHLHLPQFFTATAIRSREARYRAFCRQAKIIVVASTWARDDVSAQYGIPTSKIHVIPVPPVVEFYPTPGPADLIDVRAKLALPSEFLYYPAQTWPHKNHVRLLRAVAAASENLGEAIPLVCSGEPNDDTPRIADEARRLGLGAGFIHVGYITPLEVQCLYRLARGVVFPSLFEGWGMPVVEAFAAGTPVACSNATSLREAAADGALLFDPLDEDAIEEAIVRLWNDAELRETLRNAGTQVVGRLSWERTARTYRDLYQELGGPTARVGDPG